MNKGPSSILDAIEVPDNPYPGLRPFEYNESHLFFGRDGQVDGMAAKLSATGFLAVVGTSGSGKSSLVRAGLLPSLQSGILPGLGARWRIAVMRPGNAPIRHLAEALIDSDTGASEDPENAALQKAITIATLWRGSRGLVESMIQSARPGNENLLVVVDQFEELFRFSREARKSGDMSFDNEAAAFVKLLLESASERNIGIYVVITMRSDFLGDCSEFWDLPEAINQSQYLIPRLTRDKMRQVITGPAALCGGRISGSLINQLLNEIGDNQDQLPILQHALMRTWEEWKEKKRHVHNAPTDQVDICCYDAIGSMAGALSKHADEAWDELDDRQRIITEKLFKSLTEKGEDNREVRRPCTMGDLGQIVEADESEVAGVIDVFRRPGRSFLMPPADRSLTAESLIDISHESLIRNWLLLKGWVEEEANSARLYKRLVDSALLLKRGAAGLLRDPELQTALDWREREKPNSYWANRYNPAFKLVNDFLDASRNARQAEEEAIEESRRKEQQHRRARFLLRLMIPTGIILVVALSISVWAYFRSERALDQIARTDRANSEIIPLLKKLIFGGNNSNPQDTLDRIEQWREFGRQSGNKLMVAVAEVSIGEFYEQFEYKAQAAEHYMAALDKLKEALPVESGRTWPDHQYVGLTLLRLASVTVDLGDLKKAESYFMQAEEVIKTTYGPDSIEMANCLLGQARLRQKESKPDEAEKLLLAGFRMKEKILGVDHQQVALDHNQIAKFYFETGRPADAMSHIRQAVSVLESRSGGQCTSPDKSAIERSRFICNVLATVYSNSGALLDTNNQLDDAEKFLKQAVRIRESLRDDSNDSQLAYDYKNLAFFYERHRRFEPAIGEYRKSLAILESAGEIPGEGDPAIPGILSGLGYCYLEAGRYEEGKNAYLNALTKITAGEGQPNVNELIKNRRGLSNAYLALGETSNARNQAVELRRYAGGLNDGNDSNGSQREMLIQAATEIEQNTRTSGSR